MNLDQLMDDVLLFLSSSSSFGLFPYKEQYSILQLRTIIVMNLGNLLCAFIVAFFLYIMKKKKKIDTMLQDFINYKKENLELETDKVRYLHF